MVVLRHTHELLPWLPWFQQLQGFRELVVEDQIESALSLLDGSLQVHVTRPTNTRTHSRLDIQSGSEVVEFIIDESPHQLYVRVLVRVLTQVFGHKHLQSSPKNHRNRRQLQSYTRQHEHS